MTIKDLTEQQKQSLLDLAIMAMYADGHLTSTEDESIKQLLGTMGFETDYDREKQYDASVSRVSRHSQNAQSARSYATTLAQSFNSPDQRRLAQQVFDDLVASDGDVSQEENSLQSVVRECLEK